MALSFQDKIKPISTPVDSSTLSFADKIRLIEEPVGFVQSIAQTIASPFLRVAANIGAIGEGLHGLETAGLQAITGQKEEAQKTISELAESLQSQKEFDFGYLGKAKTFSGLKESVGVGTEIASTLLPVGKVGQAAKLTLGGKILKGMGFGVKVGATSGALAGTGQALQQDMTAEDTFYNAAISAGIGGLLGGTLGAASPVAGKLYQKFAQPYEERITNSIKNNYFKAIKPRLAGKLSKEATQKYEDNAVKGMTIIANNKDNLVLGDKKGVLPESVSELSEAVSQAKKGVFKAYNDLTKKTGLTGQKINLIPIADELDKIANDIGLQDNFPQVAVYAEQKATKLRARQFYDPETTEKVIAEYNSALKNFYVNPNYESATKVRIDALAVNRLRKSLDYLIENTTGSQYQEVKSYYGALKAIESDVNKAAVRVANSSVKGIVDLTDIFSAGDVIGGIVTLDPAFFVKGLVQKGIASWYKSINSPDNLIRKMFLDIDDNIGKIKSGKIPPVLKATQEVKDYLQNPKIGLSIEDVSKKLPVYKGEKDLTTKILERLKGKSVTSKQEILDLSNMGDLKQVERDLIRNVVGDFDKDVPVKEFANKVKTELLPLKRVDLVGTKYESIALSDELRGPVANYQENIYSSPIKTSAGEVHFPSGSTGNKEYAGKSYFAHTRIEDLPSSKYKDWQRFGDKGNTPKEFAKGDTRRVIEIQSDLFQKGRLEEGGLTSANKADEIMSTPSREVTKNWTDKDWNNLEKQREQAYATSKKEMGQLEPYRNTWHERVIREEIKQAAKDGKTKLQFPTGETAMRIEGLGVREKAFVIKDKMGQVGGTKLTPENIKPHQIIYSENDGHLFVTENLGDGKFKAIPYRALELENIEPVYKLATKKGYINKETGDFDFEAAFKDKDILNFIKKPENNYLNESYDISGKVDTNNPIYRFYEKDVQKYLTNKFGGKKIVDAQGVSWVEVPITKEMGKLPIEAFGVGVGGFGLMEDDE